MDDGGIHGVGCYLVVELGHGYSGVISCCGYGFDDALVFACDPTYADPG